MLNIYLGEVVCTECGKTWPLEDGEEYAYGHDCEAESP